MMTIDHLRVDYRVTVLREFTDATGTTMNANETGVIRNMTLDQVRWEIHIEIERDAELVRLMFPLRAESGPRNGHMREFFEMGEYAPVPGSEPVRREPAIREMNVPSMTEQSGGSPWWREARNTAGPDRQEDAEKKLLAEIPHIGAAASIAAMYAQRMRAFQAEGNEARAIAAFKLADDWIWTYASWATSGGEGAALSLERDEFRAGLVEEFGYDPMSGDT